jgi:hypothetical protein
LAAIAVTRAGWKAQAAIPLVMLSSCLLVMWRQRPGTGEPFAERVADRQLALGFQLKQDHRGEGFGVSVWSCGGDGGWSGGGSRTPANLVVVQVETFEEARRA